MKATKKGALKMRGHEEILEQPGKSFELVTSYDQVESLCFYLHSSMIFYHKGAESGKGG